jgi:hypothetical protein
LEEIAVPEQEYIPKRAMSIHAHPDDQEFTVAGTLAKWASAGCEVISVILTSGDSGSNDPIYGAGYKPILAEIREGEQTAANQTLGVKETIFLRYPDGELEPTLALRKELTRMSPVTRRLSFTATATSTTPTIALQPRLPRMPSSRQPGHGSFSQTCLRRGTIRTTSNGYTCTDRKNRIPGWTSRRVSTSQVTR